MVRVPTVLTIAVLLMAASSSHQVNAECVSSDWQNYYSDIQTCISGIVQGMQGCAASGNVDAMKTCYCDEIGKYFKCIIGSTDKLCINSGTRNYIKTMINSYKGIIDSYCGGNIGFPTYRVSFRIPNNYFVSFSQFTEDQYVQFCKNVFEAFGYDSTDYNTWCTTWTKYLKFTGLISAGGGSSSTPAGGGDGDNRIRRGANDPLQVEVTIPNDQYVPPQTDVTTLQVPYKQAGGGTSIGMASVENVEASAQAAGGGGGNNGAGAPHAITAIVTTCFTLMGVILAF